MNDVARTPEKRPWFKRRGLLVTLAVAVVLAITIITDLPVNSSRSQDVASEMSVMKELNTDIAPCALAAHQALGIWTLQSEGALPASARSGTPVLLGDDQAACSFTNESIFDLSNIEVPGTTAGKDLGDLVATATTWTTSDALRAIEIVQTLMSDPHDATALADLTKQEHQLALDRQRGLGEERQADQALNSTLIAVNLPALPEPSAG